MWDSLNMDSQDGCSLRRGPQSCTIATEQRKEKITFN